MKKILILFSLYAIKVSACDAWPVELNSSMISDNKEIQSVYQFIDDSLYIIWKNNSFEKHELLLLCGCAPGGYVLKSSHEIKDNLWAINFCGDPDSVITMVSQNNYSIGQVYVSIEKNTKLYKSIVRLKNYVASLKKCK